ncbi:Asparaginase/glutaminase [Dactylonectria estremocensis]|uniref:asparaginase n=1 Tax=Dactylonectria estremocensis TaxID=1079267 RepID=A0A9P9IK33_9HYPO|nr:Asparaginase/glutaminase [Dactylonectria estremocensis]
MNASKSSQYASEKPKIVLIATGGTVLGHAPSSREMTNYTSAVYGIDDLVKASPGVHDIAEIITVTFLSKDSINLEDRDVIKLCQLTHTELAKSDVDAVGVVGGTDALSAVACALDATSDSNKAIGVIGAVRPFSAISSDGPGNLLSLVELLCDDEAKNRGAMVVSGELILPARFTEKTDCNRINAFEAPNSKPLGRFVNAKPVFTSPAARSLGHRYMDVSKIDLPQELPYVPVLFAHLGVSSKMFNDAIDAGNEGVILAAMGSGYWPQEALRTMNPGNVPVVVCCQSVSGYCTSDGVSFGIPAGFLSAAKSRILLVICLLLRLTSDDIEDVFGRIRGGKASRRRNGELLAKL